jgi:hypothetical protein
LREAQVEAALGDLDTAALPAKTVAARRLVDLLTAPQPTVDEAAYRQNFSLKYKQCVMNDCI